MTIFNGCTDILAIGFGWEQQGTYLPRPLGITCVEVSYSGQCGVFACSTCTWTWDGAFSEHL